VASAPVTLLTMQPDTPKTPREYNLAASQLVRECFEQRLTPEELERRITDLFRAAMEQAWQECMESVELKEIEQEPIKLAPLRYIQLSQNPYRALPSPPPQDDA
jgi:hypothetical protein